MPKILKMLKTAGEFKLSEGHSDRKSGVDSAGAGAERVVFLAKSRGSMSTTASQDSKT